MNIIKGSNGLDQDQDRRSVGPDLGPNSQQKLSAAATLAATKGRVNAIMLTIQTQMSMRIRASRSSLLYFALYIVQHSFLLHVCPIFDGHFARRGLKVFTSQFFSHVGTFSSLPGLDQYYRHLYAGELHFYMLLAYLM